MKFEEFKEKILAILTGKKDDENLKKPDEKDKKTDDGKEKKPDEKDKKTENDDEIKNLKKELENRDLKIKDYEERIGNFKEIVNTADVKSDEDINVDQFLDGNRTKREN